MRDIDSARAAAALPGSLGKNVPKLAPTYSLSWVYHSPPSLTSACKMSLLPVVIYRQTAVFEHAYIARDAFTR